jgi:hypothetical protein
MALRTNILRSGYYSFGIVTLWKLPIPLSKREYRFIPLWLTTKNLLAIVTAIGFLWIIALDLKNDIEILVPFKNVTLYFNLHILQLRRTTVDLYRKFISEPTCRQS